MAKSIALLLGEIELQERINHKEIEDLERDIQTVDTFLTLKQFPIEVNLSVELNNGEKNAEEVWIQHITSLTHRNDQNGKKRLMLTSETRTYQDYSEKQEIDGKMLNVVNMRYLGREVIFEIPFVDASTHQKLYYRKDLIRFLERFKKKLQSTIEYPDTIESK